MKETTHSRYTETTRSIRVSVTPQPLVDSSEPHNNSFAFAYTITLENLGSETVQLLERHWTIESGGVQTAEISGSGVVGLQPVLAPGDAFRYSSGAVIQDPMGAMEGIYTFCSESGVRFEVTIPKFELIFPIFLH